MHQYGLVNPSGNYASTVHYGNALEHPEQHLANRMASFFSAPANVESVELNTNETGTITPGCKSGSYYPVAIGRDWRDDITTLTLIKV